MLTRVVAPFLRSRTKTSQALLVSPATRSDAAEANAVHIPKSEVALVLLIELSALAWEDEAFSLFEHALKDGDPLLVTLRIWPGIYGVLPASDPRYGSLLRRIGWK